MSPTSDSTATSPVKVAAASFIGTTVEYYDFFIYGTAAALVFPKLFFPTSSPLVGALLSFATLGVGFLARPVGGVVFGHFGDRVGRKKMLVISLVTMGLATTLMGLMPSYAVIGLAAPILLTVLRLVQGFAVGGEWGGATLMAVEHAPAGRRGFYGAFPQTGAPAGVGLATIAFYLASQLSPEQFLASGWRLPFLFSAVLVIVGLVIRLSIAESPEFEKVRDRAAEVKMPVVEAIRRHPRENLLVAGTYLSQGVLAYITMSYLVSYATMQLRIPRPGVLLGVFVAALVATALYPVFGALADRWGRKTVYLLGAALMLVSIVPAFALINTGDTLWFGIALVLVFGIAMAPAGGVTGSLFSMIFTSPRSSARRSPRSSRPRSTRSTAPAGPSSSTCWSSARSPWSPSCSCPDGSARPTRSRHPSRRSPPDQDRGPAMATMLAARLRPLMLFQWLRELSNRCPIHGGSPVPLERFRLPLPSTNAQVALL